MPIDIEDVKTLTLKENQTLVLRIGRKTYKQTDLTILKGQLQVCFPNSKVLVLDKDIELSVIEDCTDAS